MEHLNAIVLAVVVVSAGWITGKMIHGFIDFAIDFIKKQERNRDE